MKIAKFNPVKVKAYMVCFNFCGVKLSWFASFDVFTFTFTVVAESQAGEIQPCVSFVGETFVDGC